MGSSMPFIGDERTRISSGSPRPRRSHRYGTLGRMSRALSSGGSDRPGTSQLAEALAWLSERAHENLGTETALRAVALDPDLDEWRVALAGRAGGLTGVAVWASVTITREHDLLVMACRTAPTGGGGRWATHRDRQSLERYQAAYNEERGTTTAPNWDALLGRPAVAVLERSGRIVAVVKRTADTVRYATIGGTWIASS
jgi:hypothetical protein